MTKTVLLLALCAAPLSAPLAAQDTWRPTRFDAPPTIDGVLDEGVWDTAEQTSGFRTYEPDYGSGMLGDTRVYMGYDDENLYFGFEAFDPDPTQIRASVTSRDNINRDDWVAINLDSFGDQQSLYAFYVNPFGIQGDSRLAAGTEDRGVDLVWYSAGHIGDDGYVVEMRIPLKSIRFNDGDVTEMGVIFERRISRTSEWGTAPELDPARGGQWATQMHPLTYVGIENPRLFELLPAVTYTVDQAAPQGVLSTQYEASDFSLTTKIGLTSDLVLDGTYNPDFSQVEADAGQVDVNLRTDLFFPEKRSFFLEGREHFGVAATGGLNPIRSLVYTRKIVSPIVGGRISGNVGDQNTVASVFALDELDPVANQDAEYAQVPVVRYKRALDEDSYVGALYAARETGPRSNRVAGLDGQYRLSESVLLGMHAVGSRTSTEESVPTSVDGHAVAARLASSTRTQDWSVEAMDVSKDFVPDVGYLTRDGISRVAGLVRRRFFPDIPRFRRIDVELLSAHTRDHDADLWESHTRLSLANHVFGSLNVRGTIQKATEIFQGEEFDNSGFTATLGGLMSNKGAFGVSYGNQTRPIYSSEPYQGRMRTVSAIVGFQPSSRFDTETSLTSVDFYRESDSEKIYDYTILRSRVTVQPNMYLFFRTVVEYNWFREELLTDILASFTYIPGTVIHVGYGTLHDRTRWDQDRFVPADGLMATKRRLFFKTSYLFRN